METLSLLCVLLVEGGGMEINMKKILGVIILMFGAATFSVELILAVILRDVTVYWGLKITLTEVLTAFPINIAIAIPIVSAAVGIIMCLTDDKNKDN